MSVKGLILAVGCALLCSGWAKASAITEPGHFIVDLDDVFGVDSGGWGAETLFTDTVNTVTSTRGFTQNICIDPDNDNDCDKDPRMEVYQGGASSPFPASFSSDENGGGTFDFQNDGPAPITDILFMTKFVPGKSYTCASPDIFSFCGFRVVDIGGKEELEILFDKGTIPNIPEPAEYLPLLVASAAVAFAHQRRSRRVSLSSKQTR
jgi:hypothetical protein